MELFKYQPLQFKEGGYRNDIVRVKSYAEVVRTHTAGLESSLLLAQPKLVVLISLGLTVETSIFQE